MTLIRVRHHLRISLISDNMPLILYRYLVLEILPPFGVGLLAFTSIVFLGRMMKVTQMIVGKGIGVMDVLRACVYLLPYLLVFTLPMAATVGVLLAMTRLTEDREIIALKTSGLSYAQLLPPVLGFSLATALLTLFLTVFGSPWGQTATKDLLKEVILKQADLGIREQVFETHFSGLMLFINRLTPQEKGWLEGIFIYDYHDKENPQTIYAKKGHLTFDQSQETLMLNLFDGWVIRWGPSSNRWETVEFKTYQMPMQLFALSLKGSKSEPEMSQGELRAAIAQQPYGSERYNRALVEWNQRLALPFGALLLCLMAMPLGLSPRHHGRTWSMILGLVLFLVYYMVFTASWRLAGSARVNPSLAPWISNILFVWVAFYLWYRTVKELPLLPAFVPSVRLPSVAAKLLKKVRLP